MSNKASQTNHDNTNHAVREGRREKGGSEDAERGGMVEEARRSQEKYFYVSHSGTEFYVAHSGVLRPLISFILLHR
jgi:hypothetical protein